MTLPLYKQVIGLIGWLILCFTASAIGAIASVQAEPFYSQLMQPPWAPPPWVFGPVWTVLYTLMAISAWLVWRTGEFKNNLTALILFLLQLTLNALWSWLFFAWHQGLFSFVNISLLWICIIATLFSFWRLNILAGVLLVPYLLWVTFAAALNYQLWQLNPQILT